MKTGVEIDTRLPKQENAADAPSPFNEIVRKVKNENSFFENVYEFQLQKITGQVPR